jgi:hypothetical protein
LLSKKNEEAVFHPLTYQPKKKLFFLASSTTILAKPIKHGRSDMKEQYRLTFALCVMALFVAVVAFGAISVINLTNTGKDVNETNEIEVYATANEVAVVPLDTVVAAPEETTNEPAIPASTPNPIPGFGIIATLMFVLFAIYLTHK